MAKSVFQFLKSISECSFIETPDYKGKEAEYFVIADLLNYSSLKVIAMVFLYAYGIYVKKDDDKAIEILKKGYEDFPNSYNIECLMLEINSEFSAVPCKSFMTISETNELRNHHYDKGRKFDYGSFDIKKDINLKAPENYAHIDAYKEVIESFTKIKNHINATFDAFVSATDLTKLDAKYDEFYLAMKRNYCYKGVLFNPDTYYQKLIDFISLHPEFYLESIFDDADHLCNLQSMEVPKSSTKRFNLSPIFNIIKNAKFGDSLYVFVNRFIDFRNLEKTPTLPLLLVALISTYYCVPTGLDIFRYAKGRKDINDYSEITKLINKRLPNVNPDWYWC